MKTKKVFDAARNHALLKSMDKMPPASSLDIAKLRSLIRQARIYTFEEFEQRLTEDDRKMITRLDKEFFDQVLRSMVSN